MKVARLIFILIVSSLLVLIVLSVISKAFLKSTNTASLMLLSLMFLRWFSTNIVKEVSQNNLSKPLFTINYKTDCAFTAVFFKCVLLVVLIKCAVRILVNIFTVDLCLVSPI